MTLVELLVTVAVLAILLAIAAPNFSQMLQRQAVSSAMNTLTGDLRLARSEALKRGTQVALCGAVVNVARTGTTYSCMAEPTGTNRTTWSNGWVLIDTNNGSVIKVQQLPVGLGPVTASFGSITYLPTGIVPGVGANVLINPLSSGQNALAQVACINTTGRARIVTGSTSCS